MRSEPYILLTCDECGAEEEILLTQIPSSSPLWSSEHVNEKVAGLKWASEYDPREDFYRDVCLECKEGLI